MKSFIIWLFHLLVSLLLCCVLGIVEFSTKALSFLRTKKKKNFFFLIIIKKKLKLLAPYELRAGSRAIQSAVLLRIYSKEFCYWNRPKAAHRKDAWRGREKRKSKRKPAMAALLVNSKVNYGSNWVKISLRKNGNR